MQRLVWLVMCLLAPVAVSSQNPAGPRWVDDTFADFQAGTLGAGGQNLYVSPSGSVRTIQRFDLNDDGHLDLVFNCTHDTYQMLPATVGLVREGRRVESRDLLVEGVQKTALGDLDGDGFLDAAFSPAAIGVDSSRRHVTVAWGGPEGWSSRRISAPLPVHGAQTIALPDLNRDGRRDIAVLCGVRWRPEQPEGQIVRVYWNSLSGFSVTRFTDLGVPGARDLAAADLDGDGSGDLAVLDSVGVVRLYWSDPERQEAPQVNPVELRLPGAAGTCLTAADATGDGRPDLVVGTPGGALYLIPLQPGRRWNEPQAIRAFPATQITVADLDEDRAPDLVLTDFSQNRAAGGEQAGSGREALRPVRILWGSSEGFSRTRVLEVRALAPSATAAGDLDGDGRLDLVVASHQGRTTFNGESSVFFGNGNREFQVGAGGFRTAGATDVAIAPAERGVPARALFCNTIGGRLEESVPVPIYWGGPQGFDPKRVQQIPFHSGYESSSADLNEDGHPDLILLNSGHAGESAQADRTLGANLFWGTPGGFSEKSRTVIREQFLGTSTVADLNRDGYLDLVLEPFGPEKEGEPDQLFVYYGGRDGFSRSRRTALEKDGYGQEHLVADLNGDGLLDIATTTRKFHALRIYWADRKGFDAKRDQRIPVAGPVGVDAADFNRDGFLDLLVGSYNDPVSNTKDMGSLLFWGSARGYRHSNSQWLPGFAPLGRTVADLDGDGWLDLFSPQQTGELIREDLACRLYWGGPSGFHTRRFSVLHCDSVNDSMAGDFNGDGRLDLAVSCHTRHGDHRSRSRVFYNDGRRFREPRIQYLPTNGPHLMHATDLGNLYDRRLREQFVSRVFPWTRPLRGGTLEFQAEIREGCRLEFRVRSAATPAALRTRPWRPLTGGRFALAREDRCLQYEAAFLSRNGSRYPVLDRVRIALE